MRFNVPTHRYGYTLAAAQCTDLLDVEVLPQGGSGNAGLARLILDPQSPGSPANQETNLSLTNVRVSITAPRCTLGTQIPTEEDVTEAGLCSAGQTAYWKVGNVFKGSQQQYSVNYVITGAPCRRFEFMLEAAELPDPVRLQLDVSGPASP